MRKILPAVSIALLLSPGAAMAHEYRDWRWREPRTVIIRERHHTDGAAIAAGVLGGVVTGVILDRVFLPPPAPSRPVYFPPAPRPAPRDPYDDGYSEGYGRGVDRGRVERYEQGRRRGYEEGYEDARAGRIF
jgi:hypothetical protein